MNRRGAVLLVALWLVVALGVLTAGALAGTRLGNRVSLNRLALTRAAWAREACLEIVLARYANGASRSRLMARMGLDTVELGEGLWCAVTLDDPASHLNLNRLDETVLRRALDDSALAAALVRARPLPAPEALLSLPGADSARLAPILGSLTVRGDGRLDVNTLPAGALRALPGSLPSLLLARRRTGGRFMGLDDVIAMLPAGEGTARYAELAALLVFVPSELVATVDGGVRPTSLLARATVTLVPAGPRLAVIRRETE